MVCAAIREENAYTICSFEEVDDAQNDRGHEREWQSCSGDLGERAHTFSTATAAATNTAAVANPAAVGCGRERKGRNRVGHGKARIENTPSEHGTPIASSSLSMLDNIGQVEVAVATALRERPGVRRAMRQDMCPLRAISRFRHHPDSTCKCHNSHEHSHDQRQCSRARDP